MASISGKLQQIIESVSGDLACRVEVNAVEFRHDICVIRYLEIRDHRLSELLDLHVAGIVFSDRHGGIDDVRDHHHDAPDLLADLRFLRLQLGDPPVDAGDLLLHLFRFLFLALLHQAADLLRDLVRLRAQFVRLSLGLPALQVKRDHFIHQRKLLILELLPDILLHDLRILPQKLNIYHICPPAMFFQNALPCIVQRISCLYKA